MGDLRWAPWNLRQPTPLSPRPAATSRDGYEARLAIEPETGILHRRRDPPGTGAQHHEAAVALDLLDQDEQTRRPRDLRRHRLQQRRGQHRPAPAPVTTFVPGGCGLDDFAIGTAAGQVTCPAGHTVALGPATGINQQRRAVFDQCIACKLRQMCTNAKAGRILTVRPHHDQQTAAHRRAATDPDWQAAYCRWHPPVERAVAWLVTGGNRRLRYRGTIANNTWIHTRAAALNLRTLINLGLNHSDGHGTCRHQPEQVSGGSATPTRRIRTRRSSSDF